MYICKYRQYQAVFCRGCDFETFLLKKMSHKKSSGCDTCRLRIGMGTNWIKTPQTVNISTKANPYAQRVRTLIFIGC